MDWFQGWVRAVGGFHREGNEEVGLVRLDREKREGGGEEEDEIKRERERERELSLKNGLAE